MQTGLTPQTQPLTGKFDNPVMRRVRYGPGAIEHLAADIKELGGTRVMIVASSHLAGETDFVKRAQALLGSAHVGTYTGIVQHGPRQGVLEGAEMARRLKADFIVSFGGGSPIDAVKMITMCLSEGVTTRAQLDKYVIQFEYPDKLFIPPMNASAVPHLAISTTLSAGEFSNFAGALNEETQHKELFVGDKLMAREVILDPAMTVHTPAWLWGSSGLRAIDHCVETFLSRSRMPFTDAISTQALSLLIANLALSTREPNNLAARGACQVGSWMSLYALNNVVLGLSHGIGHQLGGAFNVTHGVTSAIMLPWVMEFNMAVTMDRQKRLAAAMGVDTAGMSDEEAGRAAVAVLRALVKELKLPSTLREVNIPKEGFKKLVDGTMGDLVVATNPRQVKPDDVYALLEKAY
ncbi:MAG: iron-containing alcohol dehydrogenase [Candidatus Binataceae bacterium]